MYTMQKTILDGWRHFCCPPFLIEADLEQMSEFHSLQVISKNTVKEIIRELVVEKCIYSVKS